jgi:methylglutaconyl-CoA hydratase
MEYKTIDVQSQKDLVTITLNRPDVHNAMNEELIKELTDCFKRTSADSSVRIIILTGNGKSFCAGADLHWMKSMVRYSKDENIKDSRLLLDLYDAIYNCPKVVIAKVNGHAFGGGLGLIAACDITMALPDCKFGFTEVKLGIIPSVISTYVLRRISNISQVRRLFITGEHFSSDYAERIGLIDFLVPHDEIDLKIQKYVSILRSSGPKAIVEVKYLLNEFEKNAIIAYKEHTVNKIAELRVSGEGQEGINAFLEKRKSTWSE